LKGFVEQKNSKSIAKNAPAARVCTMKSNEWNTYRTRFLVKAKQLSSSLSFTDHLGRQHSGRKGDYLVESCDGVLSITPRQIFEDVYVAMMFAEKTCPENGTAVSPADLDPARVRRKHPQPVRPASSRVGLM
jgi:hypothetical protein